jgi:DNA repair exonuclease SbcCD ATPase subunit
MKLRSIELTNVRRFAGKTAALSGIVDGITVLSEPNEFGKSTFFDALHAIFFEKYGSRNAAIKALQPHAGGAPEVAVEVDLPEGRFRIAKRWMSKPQAQVHDANGRLIAQADEAEAWIDRLIGGGLAGPSGLLWVRQGLMGLEADDKKDRERDLSARRDLLSSVAGEIDMMTGGRRMDAVIDRVADALARLATDGGRPKAGGEWKRAVDEAAGLAAEEAVLRPREERLSGDLARRTEVNRTLNRLTDTADAAARAQALTEAQAAHQAALAHHGLVTQAETALRLARLDADRAKQEIAGAETLAARVAVAQTVLAKADDAATAARARADDLGQRDRAAAEAAEALARQARDLRTRLQAATRAETAQAAKAQAEDLQRRHERATGLQATLDQTRSQRARIPMTARVLEAADNAQSALDLARARAEAQAVSIEARPDGSPAILNGAALSGGPVPIFAAAELTLPGFGTLRIDPGAGRSGEAITQAEQALAHLLAEAQVESLPAARHHWAEAQRLEAEAQQAVVLLAEVAPEGLDALRTALARAETFAADAPEATEDAASVTAALAQAEAAEQSAHAAAKAAQVLSVQAGEARAAADANRTSAERQLAAALSEAGDPAALATRIADLKARAPKLFETATNAESALAALRATAPDFATAEARLTRAKGAVDQVRLAEQRAREDLASLNATILALAEEGIEERLATLAGDLAEAEARAARYEAEVRALIRLKLALDEARTKARDAYFGPVLRELQPLLAILHPGAELTIDDQSLLPATLTRNGQAETLEILSGGTREQVAILTRLAFARLFTKSGRQVPVILDDALVHSDDDRIEAMFDALHRTARDQQIIVFTCRQRAFAALGGQQAVVSLQDT